MLSAISNDLCSNEQIFIISCDLWRLADSILFLQKSLFSGLQVTPGKKKPVQPLKGGMGQNQRRTGSTGLLIGFSNTHEWSRVDFLMKK